MAFGFNPADLLRLCFFMIKLWIKSTVVMFRRSSMKIKCVINGTAMKRTIIFLNCIG